MNELTMNEIEQVSAGDVTSGIVGTTLGGIGGAAAGRIAGTAFGFAWGGPVGFVVGVAIGIGWTLATSSRASRRVENYSVSSN